jgi:hypothetical protein
LEPRDAARQSKRIIPTVYEYYVVGFQPTSAIAKHGLEHPCLESQSLTCSILQHRVHLMRDDFLSTAQRGELGQDGDADDVAAEAFD